MREEVKYIKNVYIYIYNSTSRTGGGGKRDSVFACDPLWALNISTESTYG